MTRKTVIVLVVLFALVGITACTVSAPPASSDRKNEDRFSSKTPIADEVGKEMAAQLDQLRKDLEKLNASQPGFLATAQDNEACDAYERAMSYESLQERYNRGGFGNTDLAGTLGSQVRVAGSTAASLGYTKMKAGKALGCGGREVSEIYVFEKFAGFMDKYGPSSESEKFDSKVVRAAYLKMVRPEIKEALDHLAKYPDSADAQGGVFGLVQDAQEKWHFTLAELGVPAATWKKISS